MKGKRVVVVGLGVTGLWVARWLVSRGAYVAVSETSPKEGLDPELFKEILDLGVHIEHGGHKKETFINSDMIIPSPGVPQTLDVLREAGKRGIPVIGEMELAAQVMETPIIAITGTNGKSTTTALLGSVLGQAGLKVFVGGNLGTPLIAHALGGNHVDFAVVEVSSFQLDTCQTFSPLISVILNISPDHMDRYPDYESYVRSKLRIMKNQGSEQYAILNGDDERLACLHLRSGPKVLFYGYRQRKGLHGFVEGERIRVRMEGGMDQEFSLKSFVLPGRHNRANLLPVILSSLLLGLGPDAIQRGIDAFEGLPHRLERIGQYQGVTFYNDSKATNVDAAVKAVLSFHEPVILIAGGRHKGSDYGPLVKAAAHRVKYAVFLGEARERMARSFQGIIPYSLVDDMEQAVALAVAHASKGEVVLLAPACSSFDMFSDYEHRGRVYRSVVERITRG